MPTGWLNLSLWCKGRLGQVMTKHPELSPLIIGRNYMPSDDEVAGFRTTYTQYVDEMLR